MSNTTYRHTYLPPPLKCGHREQHREPDRNLKRGFPVVFSKASITCLHFRPCPPGSVPSCTTHQGTPCILLTPWHTAVTTPFIARCGSRRCTLELHQQRRTGMGRLIGPRHRIRRPLIASWISLTPVEPRYFLVLTKLTMEQYPHDTIMQARNPVPHRNPSAILIHLRDKRFCRKEVIDQRHQASIQDFLDQKLPARLMTRVRKHGQVRHSKYRSIVLTQTAIVATL